jgi:hypothetical protein
LDLSIGLGKTNEDILNTKKGWSSIDSSSLKSEIRMFFKADPDNNLRSLKEKLEAINSVTSIIYYLPRSKIHGVYKKAF